MDLELGHKLNRIIEDDDTSNVCELWISEGKEEPVFLSRETPSMFILTAKLQGYERNSIEIKIKEGGKEIFTSGESPIQKLVITGQLMQENQEEILGFRKVFKIPNGVVLDQIKANCYEEEAVLKILMPKFIREICGVQIEEARAEELGESSHKALNEFEDELIEIPRAEIRIGYVERVREEDGNEEIEEVKCSEIDQNVEDRIPENVEEKSKEIPESIVIQSPEESHNGVLGIEIREEIIGGREKKEIEEPNKIEIEDNEKESAEDISKEGLEALETTTQRDKSENMPARIIQDSGEDMVEGTNLKETEEPKYEAEDGDIQVKERIEELEFETDQDNINKGSVKEEIGKEAFEAVEKKVKELPKAPKEPLQMEESDNCVLDMGIREEIIVGSTKKEIEEPNNELEIEDGEKGSVGEDVSKEGLEALEPARKIEDSGKDMAEETKLKESEKPNHETEDRDIHVKEGIEEPEFETEDHSNKGSLKAVEMKEKELYKAQKEPLQMEEVDSVVEIIEGAKHTEIEEPMFGIKDETCKEGSQAMETIERWEFLKTEKHVLEAKEKGRVFEATEENEEKDKAYRCSESFGHQESRVTKKQNSESAFQASTKTILDLKLKPLKRSVLESPSESQYVKHKHEISREIDELQDIQVITSEEDKANEQGDEIYVEVSQVEEQSREIRLEEGDEEKKKLQAPLVIAGSAFVVSIIVFFVRHRGSEKR